MGCTLDGTAPAIRMMQTWPVAGPAVWAEDGPDPPAHHRTAGLRLHLPGHERRDGDDSRGLWDGKTVSEQTLAKWSDTQVVVYIGCGERGNEMTDVLAEFPELVDPRTNLPLIERTILIANTSNMPVAAREASIYTGITIAEYFRDMGYDVALMADSTSRWGEALREVSGRLEEMPGEEGYPAYLATRLSAFYERAGTGDLHGNRGPERVGHGRRCGLAARRRLLRADHAEHPAGGRHVLGAGHQPCLPPALPLGQLDQELLALPRQYRGLVRGARCRDWRELREKAMYLLQKEVELQEIVQLVGPDALPESEKAILDVTRMIREDFLQQSAYSDTDSFCPVEKQYLMLKVIMEFYENANEAMAKGVSLWQIQTLPLKAGIGRMKDVQDMEADPGADGRYGQQIARLEVEK